MGTLRFFEEVVSFKIRRTFGFADYKAGFDFRWRTVTPSVFYYSNYVFHNLYLFSPERNTITRYRSDHEMQIFRFHRRIGISGFNYPYAVDTVRAELFYE